MEVDFEKETKQRTVTSQDGSTTYEKTAVQKFRLSLRIGELLAKLISFFDWIHE